MGSVQTFSATNVCVVSLGSWMPRGGPGDALGGLGTAVTAAGGIFAVVAAVTPPFDPVCGVLVGICEQTRRAHAPKQKMVEECVL